MKNLKIYAYHRITPIERGTLSVTIENFDRQIRYMLDKGYECINLAQLYDKYIKAGREPEKKCFVITFDDGYADNYMHAYPVLKKYGITASIFLTANYISSREIFPWDKQRFEIPVSEDYPMTKNNIEEMLAYGIDFGSHTLNHHLLTTVSIDTAKEEIEKSKKVLEDMLGKEILSFCYPAGNLNEEVCKLVESAGYKLAVVTPPRKGIKETDFTLKRIGIYQKDDMFRFAMKSNKLIYYIKEITK
ncbi:MAG: polysaccharide deacetylase family protein [Clostridia bacterium]|nr:polysaccharide deacetylase family protein [Clostridia bacterium]